MNYMKKLSLALLTLVCAHAAQMQGAIKHVIKNYSGKNNIAVKVYNKAGTVAAEISPSAVVKPENFPHKGHADFWADQIAKFEVFEVDANNQLINMVTTEAKKIQYAPLTNDVITTPTTFVIDTNKTVLNSYIPEPQCKQVFEDDERVGGLNQQASSCMERCKGYKFYHQHKYLDEDEKDTGYYWCSCCE